MPLPPGYRIEWTGEFGALVEAQKRLAIIVPLSLLLIMMLLYSLFNSVQGQPARAVPAFPSRWPAASSGSTSRG